MEQQLSLYGFWGGGRGSSEGRARKKLRLETSKQSPGGHGKEDTAVRSLTPLFLTRNLSFLYLSFFSCKAGMVMSASQDNAIRSGQVLKKWELLTEGGK